MPRTAIGAMPEVLAEFEAAAERRGLEIDEGFRRAALGVAGAHPLLLITGRAGTGKSTLIHLLRESVAEHLNVAILAPTGLAAINAGGQTIHSFCRLPPRAIDPSSIRRLRERAVFEKLDLVIIDEISMVRADILDGVDLFLRLNGRHRALPFGGVRMVLVGDLFQLSPVVREEERAFFEEQYPSPWFFDARALQGAQHDVRQELQLASIELERVHRQEEIGDLTLLNAVREGGSPALAALEEINRRCVPAWMPDDPEVLEGRVTLTAHIAVAERVNRQRLQALPDRSQLFRGEVTGDLKPTQERLPAPLDLHLARGAQVLFTRNDPGGRWVNGTLGRIVELLPQAALVEVLWGPETGNVHEVGPVTWEQQTFDYDRAQGRVVSRVVGTYRQLPLVLAWAITIHKAQGMTLDRAALDLGRGAFAEGQLYVALSRCRRLDDLLLLRPIRPSDLRVSERERTLGEELRQGVWSRPRQAQLFEGEA